jgi:hypothetical protein
LQIIWLELFFAFGDARQLPAKSISRSIFEEKINILHTPAFARKKTEG